MNHGNPNNAFQDIPFHNGEARFSTRSRIGFGKQEIVNIIVALIVLTISFSFAFVNYPPYLHLDQAAAVIPLSFIAVLTGFLCHEMAHKYVGQRKGYWAEFRMYPLGLLLAFCAGLFLGVVFAAPGAVEISGNPDKDDMGTIALAGPASNVVLGFSFLILWLISTGLPGSLFYFIAYINIYLAVFNMIPIGPLDGAKVFKWRKGVWGLLFGVAISVLIILLNFTMV